MSRALIGRIRLCVVVIALFAFVGGTAAAVPADSPTLALPTPRAFVSQMDLECFRTDPYQPPTTTVVTRHLNPVLASLPSESHTLGPRNQLCVPVAKNHLFPPPGVIEFIRWVDLSCYRISGLTVNFPLTIDHLNPQLAALPRRNVRLGAPTQLCVPVIKNDVLPPPEVLELVRWIDLKCYVETPQAPLGIGLTLSQLNPVLGHIPPTNVQVTYNRQFCVPVSKNNLPLPASVLNIVRWIDIEKFDIVTPTAMSITLRLRHINPALSHLPPEPAVLSARQQLGLPMSKNGQVPPG
jgi:hypothetical protein